MHALAFSHQFLFPASAMKTPQLCEASVTEGKSLGCVGQHASLSLVVSGKAPLLGNVRCSSNTFRLLQQLGMLTGSKCLWWF